MCYLRCCKCLVKYIIFVSYFFHLHSVTFYQNSHITSSPISLESRMEWKYRSIIQNLNIYTFGLNLSWQSLTIYCKSCVCVHANMYISIFSFLSQTPANIWSCNMPLSILKNISITTLLIFPMIEKKTNHQVGCWKVLCLNWRPS